MVPQRWVLICLSLLNIIRGFYNVDLSLSPENDADVLLESVDDSLHDSFKKMDEELKKTDVNLDQIGLFEAGFRDKVKENQGKLQSKPTGTFTFEDLEKRLEFDMERKFVGSAWFGGTSPFHKFNSNCYFALGRAEGNYCVFKGNSKPSSCTSNPYSEPCGESFLPGCWHGTAKAKEGGKITNSLTCYPMARSSYMTNMLPPHKEARMNATRFVFHHILKTVAQAFQDFKKHYDGYLKHENIPILLMTKQEIEKLFKQPHFIEEIMNPKDSFWNIFMDLLKPPNFAPGNINLCAYFFNASKNRTDPLGTGKTAEEISSECLGKTKKFPIPPLCIQNYEAPASDSAGSEAESYGRNFFSYIADKEQWKLIRFITSDTLISRFKGCLCFGDRCNDRGFNLA